LPVYGQEDLVFPILDLLAENPSGLTTTDLIKTLWERLTPTGENAEPSPSRPGERKFDQIVRNTTGPERHRLTGLVQYGGPRQPITITEAGRQRLADARASGEWAAFEAPASSSPQRSGGAHGAPSDKGQASRRRRGRTGRGFGAPYRPVNPAASGKTRIPFKVDPNVIDRGTTAHKRVQTTVSAALQAKGLKPLSPSPDDPDFDVGWRIGEVWFVGEVKSLTLANEATQVRLGIAQLLEYRYVLGRRHPSVTAVLVVEREPDMTRWSDLLQSLEIEVVWPETLEAYLTQLLEPGLDTAR